MKAAIVDVLEPNGLGRTGLFDLVDFARASEGFCPLCDGEHTPLERTDTDEAACPDCGRLVAMGTIDGVPTLRVGDP